MIRLPTDMGNRLGALYISLYNLNNKVEVKVYGTIYCTSILSVFIKRIHSLGGGGNGYITHYILKIRSYC